MNEYNTSWLSPYSDSADMELGFRYRSAAYGIRSTKRKDARIGQELQVCEEDIGLANRLLTSVAYLEYLQKSISQPGCVFPWMGPIWSSQVITTILGMAFSPMDHDIPFIDRDYDRLVAFPEPEDLPELLVLTCENVLGEVIELTDAFRERECERICREDTKTREFYVRIIPVSRENFALLTSFPKEYRKDILKRLPGTDMERIPEEVAHLFPFVVSRVRLDVGDKPSFSDCVVNLYESLSKNYLDVTRDNAFVFANYIYCLRLFDALRESAGNEQQFLDLIPSGTLLGYDCLNRYNSTHETKASVQSLLFDFEGFQRTGYERRLLLERSYYKYRDGEWLEREAKKEVCRHIENIRNRWPDYDLPACVRYVLKDKESEAADLVVSWVGSRHADFLDRERLGECVMETAAFLYRRYLFSPETIICCDEAEEGGVPYDDTNETLIEDYVTNLTLVPDDEEFRCFNRATWILAYDSQDMVCSKVCNFVTVSPSSDSQKKRTYQIVCRRAYPDFKEAVADLGIEALGFSGISEGEAIEKIVEANARHNVIDDGYGVVALKIMPFSFQPTI